MVLINRRSTYLGASVSTTAPNPHLIPYGANHSPKYGSSPENVSPESGINRKFSFNKTSKHRNHGVTAPSWMYKVIGACFAVWCFASLYYWTQRRHVITPPRSMSSEWVSHDDVGISNVQFSKPALDNHHVDMTDAGNRPGVVDRWIEHRMTVLENKVQTLQKYIQEAARKSVIEKFGPGPTYRVKVTIELIRAKATKSFTIETASLDLVPHSVHIFLETVSHGLWDNTVFWHHDNVDHVISTATVMYSTGMPNHHHFDALGLHGVSFAEYSPSFPHTKYTVGFANRGPVFYINTMNNTDLHGPGGQGHHDFPDEADPCFGRIVDGLDVVDEMYKLSLEPKPQDGEQHDWDQYDLTHILRAEIIHDDGDEYHHYYGGE